MRILHRESSSNGQVELGAHRKWEALARHIADTTGYSVWINDMGYMEVHGDGKTIILAISWEGGEGTITVTIDGMVTTHIDNIGIDDDLIPRLRTRWLRVPPWLKDRP